MPEIEANDLRTRYTDWCSARIAEHLLALSPEEVFLLSERGVPSDAAPTPNPASGSFSLPSRYSRAERSIQAAHAELGLPTFEDWKAEYARDPARFDADILGFRRAADRGDQLPRTGT
ncbi:MAG TPA: hypothetical protein VHG51_17920 [Longimicrobiaceae bacterium]|nr:hypothetical protein [Longimicrobiaceae bacterium]